MRIAAVGVLLLGAWLVFQMFGPTNAAISFDERSEKIDSKRPQPSTSANAAKKADALENKENSFHDLTEEETVAETESPAHPCQRTCPTPKSKTQYQ